MPVTREKTVMTAMADRTVAVTSRVASTVVTRIGYYRWTICALLFFATTINYMDRQVIGLLKPTLMGDLHWTETDFGDIVATFSLFYAFGYVGVGRLMDKVGVRLGLSCSVAAWSLFACLHAAMSSVLGFKFVRGGLGIAEGGNFPACIKSIAEWFPVKERALATGIFNAGSNVGAVAAPIIVPLLLHVRELAGRFPGDRRHRLRLGDCLAPDLSEAGRASETIGGGTGLYSQRSGD